MDKLQFESCKEELEKLHKPEERIKTAINLMEGALSQGDTPYFKGFWEMRKLCLELFKETLPPPLRAVMWEKYTTLSAEARRLKEIRDKESTFAEEQVQSAINFLTSEVDAFLESVETVPQHKFQVNCSALKSHAEQYRRLQGKLKVISPLTAKLHSFRKDLSGSQMRVKQKNRFFETLSELGNKIFPLRKALIKEVSELFVNDVKAFASGYFKKDKIDGSPFALKGEIKSLQAFGKELTLNSASFNEARKILSECWEKVKAEEEVIREERKKKQGEYQKHAEEISQEIATFKEDFEGEKLSLDEAIKKLKEISSTMRQKELGPKEVKGLKGQLFDVRKKVDEKGREVEKKRRAAIEEKQRLKREQFDRLIANMNQLIEEEESKTVDLFEKELAALKDEMHSNSLEIAWQREVDVTWKLLDDLLLEKRERVLLEGASQDVRERIKLLKGALKERRKRRLEIKEQLEQYRKERGSSGLDFAQAMIREEERTKEKERLSKVDESIAKIEEEIIHLRRGINA